MSDLLSIGRSGVRAYQGALAAIGENVSNADTEGYARRTVALKEQSTTSDPFSLNRTGSLSGVGTAQVERAWDQFRAASAWSATSDSSRASTRAQYLSSMETMLDNSDTGVGTKLTAVFTSASQLSSNPTDVTLRQTMISALGDVASAMRQTSASLDKMADSVATQANVMVGQVNDELGSLGKINVALHSAAQGSAGRAQLEDQRDSLVSSISKSLAVDVTLNADGSASLKMNDATGPDLLEADSTSSAYLMLKVSTTGILSIDTVYKGATTTATPIGGTLSGLVDIAATLTGRRQQLDGIATDFIGAMKNWQQQGRTAANLPGAQLLTGTSAATMTLAVTDPAAIAGADTLGNENGNLLAITALRGSGGVEESWQSMVNQQALLVSSAKTEDSAASSRKDTALSSLDEVSGVDLDNEAADLLRYQQAYQASSKIIQTARSTLQSILDLF